VLTPGDAFSGLFKVARLPVWMIHVPVAVPGGTGVLDVTYVPTTEERALDAVRAPMSWLALIAVVVIVAFMHAPLNWLLGLVDDLRRAAESIDSGRLDARLPDFGRNEIGALGRALNRLIERLGRRSQAQARFVADASHELATPVAGIRGYTSILREWGGEDETVRTESIDAIDRESRRMARLTGDLLSLLHADQGIVLKSERVDLNALVRDRLAATASRWLDKDIEFEGPDDEQLIMIGDPHRIEDVISILLENASKYTPPGGRVSATTTRQNDLVCIRVADTGQGIPQADLPRIFDRFFRSEASRAAGEGGFGLGLAIAKSIVDSMAGDISVDSALGEGTTFTVTLPRGRV
jgi:signal transduction histidine kinase